MNEQYFVTGDVSDLEGDVSDLEHDQFFDDAARTRLLNPRTDGRGWDEGMFLRLKHPSEYDVNGCKIETPCAAPLGVAAPP